MSELTLLALQLGFLGLLWIFVFAIVYALRNDLFGQSVKKLQTERNEQISAISQEPGATLFASGRVKLEVISGTRAGAELELDGNETVTIGRATESTLLIRDNYTSSHHARLKQIGTSWHIEDLDSTNGTFVNETKISTPTPIPLGAPVRVGNTVFKLREL